MVDQRCTGEPKKLLPLGLPEVRLTAAYELGTYQAILDSLAGVHDITVEYGELLYLGSPRGRLVIVKGRNRFRGYLSKFEPSDMAEDEEPTLTATVRIVP